MDSEAKGLVLASFTIDPPELHLRDGARYPARFDLETHQVSIRIQVEDGSWKYWGWVEREKYEEAKHHRLPIVYRSNLKGSF